MPTMPRLTFLACTTLACAGCLLFACGMASSGAADECGESYRICNSGCDRAINGNSGAICKIHCDYRLIACDQQSAAASLTQGSRYSVSRPSAR